jgi:hypothetical protein
MVNRTQALVLGFFVLAMTSLLVILAAAPEVYDQALRLPTGNRAVEIAFLAALLGFIALLGIGVLRRWRWAFWLILVAFLAGVLRVPVAILQLTEVLTADGPAGMSPSRGCWASSSSPSAWPWWPAIVVLASGGSSSQSTRSGNLVLQASGHYNLRRMRGHQLPGRSCWARIGPREPAAGRCNLCGRQAGW